MQSSTAPLEWEILTRGDPDTTFESLYVITETAKIVEKMEGLVESIVSKGKRTEEQWEAAKKIDEAHQKELRLVLEKIKLLCSPGAEWREPVPEQHVLREEKAKVNNKRVLHVRGTEAKWRFNFLPQALIDNDISKLEDDKRRQRFKEVVEDDLRNNFYFLLPDLLGLFLSKLGIAPPHATVENFYIPILALYARWAGVMLEGGSTPLSQEDIEEFEPDPDFPTARVVVRSDKQKSSQPNMYQITWTEADKASGEPNLFSLGASLGGYYGSLGTRNFGGLLRKARWDICDRDKGIVNIVAHWDFTGYSKTMGWKWAKTGGSIDTFRYGNCAETYTFLHMLSHRTPQERARTKGIALSPRGTTLDPDFDKKSKDFKVEREYKYEHITQQRKNIEEKIRDFFTGPCANCTFMGRIYEADLKQFDPVVHLPFDTTT
ncbi:hypothetical protein QC764_511190 [Podospora pseudoanserina]|uniref:Uncharacterized protein n=1 Tax=Podospora pseudoanserina TaxID=2609844 RepID=A0ABR0I7Q6_9PEZI|nr:hypothetical protein QC764_511190 [Podospora pseudoanserina]